MTNIGVFDKNWFIQLIGIPAGGSQCVQIIIIILVLKLWKTVNINYKYIQLLKTLKPLAINKIL